MADSYNEIFGLGTHSEDADLAFWLKMDEFALDTVVADSSSNGNNFTAQRNTSVMQTSTGPNSWISDSFDFIPNNDYLSATYGTGTGTMSMLMWVEPDDIGGGEHYIGGTQDSNRDGSRFIRRDGSQLELEANAGSTQLLLNYNAGALAAGTWQHIGYVFEDLTTSHDLRYYADGSLVKTVNDTNNTYVANLTDFKIGRRPDSNAGYWDGKIAHWAQFTRALTDDEVSEVYSGPEPLNDVAPTVSGSSFLVCSPGFWDSQSNGTVTYSYQWTRSDDAVGTGEADISGETSSTYTVQSPADDGKWIRCRVAASNDGGNDSAQDTGSNFIAVSGGFQVAWASSATVVARSL